MRFCGDLLVAEAPTLYWFFNMLMAVKSAITGRPPLYLFCIVFLLGSRYAVVTFALLKCLPPSLAYALNFWFRQDIPVLHTKHA